MHHPGRNGTASQQQSSPCLSFDLTGPSTSTSTSTTTTTTRSVPLSQRIAYCLDLGAVEPDPTSSIAPWNQPNGARQQSRWAPAAAAVPSGYPLPCSAALSLRGEPRQSLDGFPRPLPGPALAHCAWTTLCATNHRLYASLAAWQRKPTRLSLLFIALRHCVRRPSHRSR